MPATETEPRTITRHELAKKLNEDLAREYQAIIAYVVYSQALKGAQYMSVAKELEIHAGEELQHAIAIAKQIDYLGEMPTGSALPVVLSEDAETMLRADLENENETIRNYRERVRQCEALAGRSRRGDSRDPQAGAGSPDRAGDGPGRGRARRVEGQNAGRAPEGTLARSRASRPPRPGWRPTPSTSAGSGGYFAADVRRDRGDVVGRQLRDDRLHQLHAGPAPRPRLNVEDLACEVARRALRRSGWHVADTSIRSARGRLCTSAAFALDDLVVDDPRAAEPHQVPAPGQATRRARRR